MAKLTNSQIKHLKGLAHDLKPVVMIGDKGLTDAVMEEIKIALEAHELIKVNVRAEEREERQQMIEKIIKKSQSVKVQTIGSKLVIFKRHKQPKLELPK